MTARSCPLTVVVSTSLEDGTQRRCACADTAGHAPPCACRHQVKDVAYRAMKASEPDKRSWKENG